MNPNSNNNQNDVKWLSMAEASSHTPYSAEYLSLLARKGKLVSKKINGVWYTSKVALDDYMQKQMLRAQVLGGSYPKTSVENPTPVTEVAPADVVSVNGSQYDPASLKKLRSFHDDIRAYMEKNNLPLPKEDELATTHDTEKLFRDVTDKAYADRRIAPEFFPQLDKQNVVADTLGAVREETHKGIADTLEKVLDKKLGEGKFGTSSLIDRIPALPRKSWKTVTGSKVLLAVTVLLMIGLTTLPVPFVFSSFEGGLGSIKNWATDANTVMGYRPGTHKNEILLLDKSGNIVINGHIETGGQLQSHIADGTAPIVVDSKTLVNNLNAQYIDGASTTDFTLAFVTKNGAVTTDDVSLLGSVEVGKTLMVKGATKLLNSLSVDGDLAVFGNAEFSQALSVLGPASFKQLVTAEDNLVVKKNESIRGSLNVGNAISAASATFGALEVSGPLHASGKVELGSPGDVVLLTAKNITLDKDGNETIPGTLAAANFSGAGTLGSLAVTGTTTLSTLLVNGSSTLQNFTFVNATGTNATTTSLYSNIANFDTLFAGSLSVNNNSFTVGSQLTLTQSQNGVTQFSARRATDSAPSGDFISYTNAGGDTPLFRVDNSGNIFAGGISNSGALTVTSASQPQFRVQYDSSNEVTVSVNAQGVTTYATNGATPRLVWMPATNRTDAFQFQNASGTSVLDIDTTNQRVGIGTTTPWGALSASSTSVTPTLAIEQKGSGPAAIFLGGNVGIGSTSPLYALTVAPSGLVSSAQTAFIQDATPVTGKTKLLIKGGAADGANDGLLEVQSNNGTTLMFVANGNRTTFTNGIGTGGIGGNYTAAMNNGSVYLNVSGSLFWSSNANGVQGSLDSNISRLSAGTLAIGNGTQGDTSGTLITNTIGVGTSTPNQLLTVYGNINISSTTAQFLAPNGTATAPSYSFSNSTADGMYLPSSGVVQIQGGNHQVQIVSGTGIFLDTNGVLVSGARVSGVNGVVFGWSGSNSTPNGALDTGISRLSANKVGIGNGTLGNVSGTLITGIVGVGTSTPWGQLSASSTSASPTLAVEQKGTGPSAILQGGNVGIGTTTPDHILTIATSQAETSPAANGANGIRFSGTQSAPGSTLGAIEFNQWQGTRVAGIYSTRDPSDAAGGTGGTIIFATKGSGSVAERMRINYDGNIGIGTTSPTRKLQIHENNIGSNGSPLVKVTSNVSGSSDSDGVAFGLDSANNGYLINYENAPFFFMTNAATQMTLDQNGRLGIGTTTPDQPLQVNGTNGIGLGPNGGSVYPVLRREANTGGLAIFSYVGSTQAYTQNVTFQAGGNVGIGTTTPGALLQVAGGSGVTPVVKIGYAGNTNGSSQLQFLGGTASQNNGFNINYYKDNAVPTDRLGFVDGGTTEVLTLKNGGNVGIGSTNPDRSLVIDSGNQAPLYIGHSQPAVVLGDGSTFAGKTNSTAVALATGAGNYFPETTAGDSVFGGTNSLFFGTGLNTGVSNGTTRMVITSNGNVGIGTTSPIQKFSMVGGNMNLGNANDLNLGYYISNDRIVFRDAFGTYLGNLDAQENIRLVSGGNAWVIGSNGGFYNQGATGGDLGFGSINISGDIYKNSTKYNNPDYVLESYYTGHIVKFAANPGASTYPGVLDLDQVEAYTKANYQLPRVASASGIFERGDITLEKLEEIYLHLFELNHKLASTTDEVAGLHVDLAAATSSIADLQLFASTTAARLDSLEARTLALENASSTGITFDATTTNPIVSGVLLVLGSSIVNGITHFKDVVVAALTVGSSDLPSGITIYDTATGAPYCITVENGVQKTSAGKCSAPTAPAMPNPITGNGTSTPVITIISGDTASSTDASSTPPTDTASSTPTVTHNTASSTPPTDTASSTVAINP